MSPATTEHYTLSLHDALPIWTWWSSRRSATRSGARVRARSRVRTRSTLVRAEEGSAARRHRLQELLLGLEGVGDRKSTRLNSSHVEISYAVFCLKKKTTIISS